VYLTPSLVYSTPDGGVTANTLVIDTPSMGTPVREFNTITRKNQKENSFAYENLTHMYTAGSLFSLGSSGKDTHHNTTRCVSTSDLFVDIKN
jgi:hypothetical protein